MCFCFFRDPRPQAGYDAISVWAKDSAVRVPLGSIKESHQSGYVDRLRNIYQRKIYYSKTLGS
jgi:hypothetical protein